MLYLCRYICRKEKSSKEGGPAGASAQGTETGCGCTFYGCDSRVLSGLPDLVRDTFNIVAVGEVVFDREVLVMLRDHVAQKKGIAAFRRLLVSMSKTAFFRVRSAMCNNSSFISCAYNSSFSSETYPDPWC